MSSYRGYGQLDEQVVPNGDLGFLRVRSRVDPSQLRPSELADARNVRLDRRVVMPRGGAKRLEGTPALATSPALIPPFMPGEDKIVREVYDDGVRASCVYAYGADSFKEYVAMFTGEECVLFHPFSQNVVRVSYPGAETVESGDVCQAAEVGEWLYLCRGKSKPVMRWSGDVADEFEVVPTGDHALQDTGYRVMPSVEWFLQHRNRFVVPVDRWSLWVSGVKEWDTYNSIDDHFQFEQGTDDYLMGADSFQKNNVIVGMRKSLHMLVNLGADTALAEPEMLTREFGIASARGLLVKGSRVFTLSDGAAYALTITDDLNLVGADRAISDDVDWFDDVNWDAIESGYIFPMGSRIGYAVPTGESTRPNEVFWYNLLNESVSDDVRGWESRDTYPSYVDNLLRSRFARMTRPMMLNVEGGLYELDQAEQHYDEYGGTDESGLVESTDIAWEITTREYRGGKPGVTLVPIIESEVVLGDGAEVQCEVIVPATGYRKKLSQLRVERTGREFRRQVARVRGTGVQVRLAHGKSGLVRVRRVGLESRETARRGSAYSG